MAKVHGKNAHFETTDTGTTTRNLSSFLTNVELDDAVDVAESSAFGQEDKTYAQGQKGHTLRLQGQYDPTASTGPDAVLSGLANGTVTTDFIYGPGGSASGLVKYSGTGILTSYNVSSPIAGIVTFSADIQVSGAVARGTFG